MVSLQLYSHGSKLTNLQWQGGRRGTDGWNRWTRRRKWYRDAELVEVEADEAAAAVAATPSTATATTDETEFVSGAAASQQPGPRPSSPAPSQTGTVATFSTSATSGSDGSAVGTNGAADTKNATPASSDIPALPVVNPASSGDNAETASILSTSSKSARLKPPGMRRRVTDNSVRGVAAPAITTAAVATAIPSNGSATRSRSRRGSEAEEADILSSSVGVKPHGNSGSGSWGYGDEAMMGLD